MRCMCPLYDPNRQLWIELAPMSIPRINHGVLSAGKGELFIYKVNIIKNLTSASKSELQLVITFFPLRLTALGLFLASPLSAQNIT